MSRFALPVTLVAMLLVVKTSAYLCEAPVDFMLVLDDSSSMNTVKFNQVRNFSQEIAKNLLISEEAVHMGVVKFDRRSEVLMPLTSDGDAVRDLLATYGRFPSWYGTNIGDGIYRALEEFAERGRSNRAKFLLLLSDGGYSRGPDPYRLAAKCKANEEGCTFLSVGIEIAAQHVAQFQSWASYPVEQYYIFVPTFSELLDSLERILREACIPCPLTCCGHGFCNPKGTPPCVCESGYTGDDCCTVAPDWLVPLAAATTGLVFLAAAAALMLGAMKHGTGALPVPIEEIEIVEEPELEEVEVMAMEEPVFAGELDLDTDTGAIGTGAQGPAKPNAGSIFRGWAPQIAGANTVKSTRDGGEGVVVGGKKQYSQFDLPKRF